MKADPRPFFNWKLDSTWRARLADFRAIASIAGPDFIEGFCREMRRRNHIVTIGDGRNRARMVAFWLRDGFLANIGIEPFACEGLDCFLPRIVISLRDFQPTDRALADLGCKDWPPRDAACKGGFTVTWEQVPALAEWCAVWADAHFFGWLPPDPNEVVFGSDSKFGPHGWDTQTNDLRAAWSIEALCHYFEFTRHHEDAPAVWLEPLEFTSPRIGRANRGTSADQTPLPF